VELEFDWRENKAQYQTGESLYLNRILVASYGWNSSQSKGNEDITKRYSGRLILPSLRNSSVYAASESDIKVEIERIVNNWFTEALRV